MADNADRLKGLRERYTGDVATTYEDVRQGKQWTREHELLCDVLDHVSPETVLDIPCGTGRFHAAYQSRGIVAIGVDASEDMLQQARARGWDAVCYGDVLSPIETRADLAVCFRLLNWMTQDEAITALTHLREAAKYLVCSISLGTGRNGRTVAQPASIFEAAGWSPWLYASIIEGPTWKYQVVACE